MNDDSETYEDILLEGWEEVYRKSQLSLLMLLALKEGPKTAAEVKQFMLDVSGGLQTTDDQSIYRTLRRFNATDMISFEEIETRAGPKKKRYSLTPTGQAVLTRFLHRNIIHPFYEPHMRKLIEGKQNI